MVIKFEYNLKQIEWTHLKQRKKNTLIYHYYESYTYNFLNFFKYFFHTSNISKINNYSHMHNSIIVHTKIKTCINILNTYRKYRIGFKNKFPSAIEPTKCVVLQNSVLYKHMSIKRKRRKTRRMTYFR